MSAVPFSYSSPWGRVRKPSRVTRRLLRKPSTVQLRTVTSCSGVSTGVATRMPRPPAPGALRIVAPWQSRVTPDAVMSTPSV